MSYSENCGIILLFFPSLTLRRQHYFKYHTTKFLFSYFPLSLFVSLVKCLTGVSSQRSFQVLRIVLFLQMITIEFSVHICIKTCVLDNSPIQKPLQLIRICVSIVEDLGDKYSLLKVGHHLKENICACTLIFKHIHTHTFLFYTLVCINTGLHTDSLAANRLKESPIQHFYFALNIRVSWFFLFLSLNNTSKSFSPSIIIF